MKIGRATRALVAGVPGASWRRSHGTYVMLSYAPLPQGDIHISCAVSKKIAHLAVDRNRIKRQCRTAAREIFSHTTLSGVFIFHAKKTMQHVALPLVRDDIVRVVSQVNKFRYIWHSS